MLASLATYPDALGAFEVLFEAENGDWQRFYTRVEALAELEDTGRAQALSKLGEQMQPVSSQQQVAADGDNDGADEVQCESFSSHGGDGKALR
ncbi:MAG: aminopeptidase [Pseudomonadales bacterium]